MSTTEKICHCCKQPIGLKPNNAVLHNGFIDAANNGVFVCFACRDAYYQQRKTMTHAETK